MIDMSELTESVKGYIEGFKMYYKENIKFQKIRL